MERKEGDLCDLGKRLEETYKSVSLWTVWSPEGTAELVRSSQRYCEKARGWSSSDSREHQEDPMGSQRMKCQAHSPVR